MKLSHLTKLWASSRRVAGTGNRFLLFDAREGSGVPKDPARIAELCLKHSWQPDGVLVIESTDTADAFMRIWNCDGSEATFCGNGLRCVALSLGQGVHVIETRAGRSITSVEGTMVTAALPQLKVLNPHLISQGLEGAYLYTGTEHFVAEVASLKGYNLQEIGPRIRYDAQFAPFGANVNLYTMDSKGIHVRTYEKGVERETVSCGSGSAAVAYAVLFQKQAAHCTIQVSNSEALSFFLEGGQLFMCGTALLL